MSISRRSENGAAGSIEASSNIPPVTGEQSEKIKSDVRNMVTCEFTKYYPEVIISYATGTRDNDEKGTGPGLVQAANFIRALHAEGIDTFSGLHVPAATDWKTFMLRLSGRKSNAKVILALLTKAFYHSLPCLNEMSEACKEGVRILPIRIEDDLPNKRNQWENLFKDDASDDDLEVKIMTVQEELEKKLNSCPWTNPLHSTRYGVEGYTKGAEGYCRFGCCTKVESEQSIES